MMTSDQRWDKLGTLIKEQTGRTLVGTGGGLYAFTETELRVPQGTGEGVIHELCHWVVASDEERRMPNLGLSMDWTHPGYDRMVRCEELAWSLQFYLFGDPTVEKMASYLTPEARASGGGSYISSYEQAQARQAREKRLHLEEAAKAELERGKHLVDREAESLRREALQRAEQVGLNVKALKQIVEDLPIEAYWEDIRLPPEPPPPPVKYRCTHCSHIHCGVARWETSAEQCGYPLGYGDDRWWCRCYGDKKIRADRGED